jgi:hypothetical protein
MTANDRPKSSNVREIGLVAINSLIRSRLYLDLEGKTPLSMLGQSVSANPTANPIYPFG